MRRLLQRFPSLLARNFLHSPASFRPSNIHRVVPSLDRAIPRFVFFSSESDSTPGSNSNEIISTEELKKRIQSFLDDGDEEALPKLFEAMMNRKLSGKHDESDDEVMEVVRKYPVNDAHKVDDNNSDIESDGLSDGDSSDSDIEDDGLRDGDTFDSDNEVIGLRDGDTSDSDNEVDGVEDVDLSDLVIKINGPKTDRSSYSDSESD